MKQAVKRELIHEAMHQSHREGHKRDLPEIVWEIAERRINAGELKSSDYDHSIEEAIASIDFTKTEVITL